MSSQYSCKSSSLYTEIISINSLHVDIESIIPSNYRNAKEIIIFYFILSQAKIYTRIKNKCLEKVAVKYLIVGETANWCRQYENYWAEFSKL